jgi:uncharacterized protein YggE
MFVAGLGAQAVVAQQPVPAIVVSAMGESRIAPDRASILIGVQSRAKTAALAGSENARRQKAVLDTLRALGLQADQLTTTNYSVYPETRYEQATQNSVVVGYVVSNNVRVELRSLDLVARVIDAALAKGANQISSLDFYPSNPDATRRTALAQAVERARADADALARAAGGSLGGLLELSSNDMGGPPIIRKEMAMRAEAAMAPTPIEPGSELFRVSVTARWQFISGAR